MLLRESTRLLVVSDRDFRKDLTNPMDLKKSNLNPEPLKEYDECDVVIFVGNVNYKMSTHLMKNIYGKVGAVV